jgi:hypothetical protein
MHASGRADDDGGREALHRASVIYLSLAAVERVRE